MTDEPDRQDYPAWLHELAERWRRILIPEWKLILVEEVPFKDDDPPGEARSSSNARYKVIRIWINLRHRMNDARRGIEESLVHEILHGPVEAVDLAYRPALNVLGSYEQKLVEMATEAPREQLIEHLAWVLVGLAHGEDAVKFEVRPR